jgi:hypothetical protein
VMSAHSKKVRSRVLFIQDEDFTGWRQIVHAFFQSKSET